MNTFQMVVNYIRNNNEGHDNFVVRSWIGEMSYPDTVMPIEPGVCLEYTEITQIRSSYLFYDVTIIMLV